MERNYIIVGGCEYDIESSYIYIYLNPLKPGYFQCDNYRFNFEPFYVGKGTSRKRFKQHISDAILFKKNNFSCEYLCGNKRKHYKILNILNQNIKIPIYIIPMHISELSKKEISFIKTLGRKDLGDGPLLNMTNGGEGSEGRILSEDSKNKISNGNKGKIITVETRQKLSIANAGSRNPFFGKSHSESTIEKLRSQKVWLGRKHSKQTRELMQIRGRERKQSDSAKLKNKLSHIGRQGKLPAKRFSCIIECTTTGEVNTINYFLDKYTLKYYHIGKTLNKNSKFNCSKYSTHGLVFRYI